MDPSTYPVHPQIKHSTDPDAPVTSFSDVIVIRIEVSDTGSGLDQSDMKRGKLFSPFIQSASGKQAGRLAGSGLGLSIVRQIVSLSKGRLGVQSQVGVGSTFWVELREFLLRYADCLLILLAALLVGSATLAPVSQILGQNLNAIETSEAMVATDEAAKYRVSQTMLSASAATGSVPNHYGISQTLRV